MSGVLMGHRLLEEGFGDLTIYEKGDSVGGTWRENTYPGLHCDVPSHHYCYSFAPNPDWTRQFAGGPEIASYFRQQALTLGVMPYIRFNTVVTKAEWTGNHWVITLADGTVDRADLLISATGFLHKLHYPEIPGLEHFAGDKFHTARWDHSVPLENKRISIIGNGSTGVQLVTALAGKVRQLNLFQRTPQWVLRVPNEYFSEEDREGFREAPERMREIYEGAIELNKALSTGVMYADSPFRQTVVDSCHQNLAKIRDPELRRRLTPDYEPGCKRLVMSPDFYEAIQRPQTELIDEGIERVLPHAILTRTGRTVETDVLVLATGFDAAAYVRPMQLIGHEGVSLDEVWSPRPTAYHSMAVPQMPNFFMIGGPYSPVGNISLVLVSEWQTDWIMKCVRRVAAKGVALMPTREATAACVENFRNAARKTIWATGGCTSWYQDEEGIPLIYPYTFDHFRTETLDDPTWEHFSELK